MTVKKNYTCDLCGSGITATDGIGIFHHGKDEIDAVWLHKEGIGHHLCNNCVKGLRGMLSKLDQLSMQHQELDAAEAAVRA